MPRPILSRRTFLHGTGVALALPMLESMTPGRRAVAADDLTAGPRRMVLICTALGLHGPFFFPDRAGRDYTPSPYLEMFGSLRNDLTVFSGLSHPDVNRDHGTEASFLTAAPHPEQSSFKNTISLDQFAAERIGNQTRFPSLTLNTGANSLSWTPQRCADPGRLAAVEGLRPLVPRGLGRRSPDPGPPAPRRPEHHGYRFGPRPRSGAYGRARRPREARRVLHRGPRSRTATRPKPGVDEDAQAESRRRASPRRPQRGRRGWPGATDVRPDPPCATDRLDAADHALLRRDGCRPADSGGQRRLAQPVAPRSRPGKD